MSGAAVTAPEESAAELAAWPEAVSPVCSPTKLADGATLERGDEAVVGSVVDDVDDVSMSKLKLADEGPASGLELESEDGTPASELVDSGGGDERGSSDCGLTVGLPDIKVVVVVVKLVDSLSTGPGVDTMVFERVPACESPVAVTLEGPGGSGTGVTGTEIDSGSSGVVVAGGAGSTGVLSVGACVGSVELAGVIGTLSVGP